MRIENHNIAIVMFSSSHVDPLLGVAFFIIIYNFRLRNNADLKS